MTDRVIWELAASAWIDSLENLNKLQFYIFHGNNDTVVNIEGAKANEILLKKLGAFAINTEYGVKAGHGWVTDAFGLDCGNLLKPWINNCNFNLAYDMM